MKKKFSLSWKSSKQPRKQRKYRYNAPIHIKMKFVNVHLSKELRSKYKKRSIGLKSGDKVQIMRGQYRSKTGKVEKINIKKSRVYITGLEVIKKDGTKTLFSFNPSNLVIIELNIDDKQRQRILNRKIGGK